MRALLYVRMSTDHQQYSTANQSQAIREYAARNGFKIERTYTDSGKSGLTLEDRDALKELIDDVQNVRFVRSANVIVCDSGRPGSKRKRSRSWDQSGRWDEQPHGL
jgi:DNA invertase Pin-like site-specific DNA recombinase